MPGKHIDVSRADELIGFIQKVRDGEPSLVEVMAMAELLASTLQPYFKKLDTTIYGEFRQIAQYIEKTKNEIGSLQANEMSENRIPEAGLELDAVVKATESATDTIMESAETIMATDTSDPAVYQEAVNGEVMKIFEACSFQDITGQRITKVVETLNFIDSRISKFASTFGIDDDNAKLSDEEKLKEKRKEEQILHGPQMDGEGVAQDDIDAMFSNDDETEKPSASQDDIDALFH